MRKIILYILSISLCSLITLTAFFPPLVSANAQVDYRRIITSDTPFYSDQHGTNLLFYLPYTYYVKVLEHGENLTHIECYGTGGTIALDGFVPTEKLFVDNLPVPSPYLEKEITTISTCVLYADTGLETPVQYVFASRQLTYYGQATANDKSIIFYVGYNGKLGYVKETDVFPFEIDLHPNELTFLAPEEELTPNEPSAESDLFTVRIVIVSCLVLAGIIALFIAVKRVPQKNASGGYYDENEYE